MKRQHCGTCSFEPRYIEPTFRALEAEYGSVMNFIQTTLDVSDEELQVIRSALLE